MARNQGSCGGIAYLYDENEEKHYSGGGGERCHREGQ